jgi:predicted RNA-binding Zn ribbon-like protein
LDFDSYNNCGVDVATRLVNSGLSSSGDEIADSASLCRMLEELEISGVCDLTDDEVQSVRDLRPRLLAVFQAADEGTAGDLINELLLDAQAVPFLTRHDGEAWHMHYSPPGRPLWSRLAAEAAIGLASVIRAGGFERFRTCAADDCDDVFVDASKNQSRRFCNPDTCGNRATTAAYRARRKQAAPQ